LLTLLTGCTLSSESKNSEELRDSLLRAQKLFARKDYNGSLKEYQRVLLMAGGRTPADAAYFNLGLIHVDPHNPKKDTQKAVESFTAVVAGYPQSPLADQARTWAAVLDDSDKTKQELENLKQELENSKQAIEKSRQEIERSKQMMEKARQEAEKSRQEIEKSRQVMEKSKQVDIEIEQKRRERGR